MKINLEFVSFFTQCLALNKSNDESFGEVGTMPQFNVQMIEFRRYNYIWLLDMGPG